MSLIKCLSIYRISFVFTFLLLSIDSIAMKPALRCNDFLGDSPRLALTEDPFLSSERIEMEIRRVTEEISLRFGADLETNLHLESLLGKVTGENLALYGLQVRLLENRIVPKTEFVGRLFRLQKIREELDRLGSSLGVFTTDFAETPQGGKQIQRQISVSRKAQKDIDALQPLYQKKYYQFGFRGKCKYRNQLISFSHSSFKLDLNRSTTRVGARKWSKIEIFCVFDRF